VVGLENPKRALMEMVVLPSLNPGVFSGLRSPPRALLLFGPPGNGKTFLAKAVASMAKRTFFAVTASSMTSKWHGEGEKLMRALFAVAQRMQPSLIFFDEVDALLSSRGESGEHEASRRLKNEFLTQLDGAASTEGYVVLAATNRPQDIDEAALRRFPRRIFLDLPDADAREKLLVMLLSQDTKHTLSPADLHKVVEVTAGLSSSDLTSLCREASLVPLRDYKPEDLANLKPSAIRPLSAKDFTIALQTVRPSCTAEKLTELQTWAGKYGS
jgi:spastin